MAEYVRHERNGLLFDHRDARSLSVQMRRLADDPDLARALGARGYLQSEDGDVPDMREHAAQVERIYAEFIERGAR